MRTRATDCPCGLLAALAVLLLLALASPGRAAEAYLQRQVIVRYDAGTALSVQQRIESAAGAQTARRLPGGSVRLALADPETVGQAVAKLRRDPRVTYAVPNYVA